MATPWKIIEAKPEAAAALSWRRWLGPTFNAVVVLCLRETRRSVERIPCERGCACNHRVRKRGAAWVGVCDCGEECDDIPLTEADIRVWELKLPLLGRAVAKALGCDGREMEFGLRRTWQVAAAGEGPTPVILTLQPEEEHFRSVVGELVARLPEGFILLAPTKSFCNAASSELLAKVKAGFMDLESNLTLRENGELEAHQSGKRLFARLLADIATGRKDAERPTARYRFRQAGSMCDIVFDGSPVFHLNNTDGAKYLDYLLHHPNKAIRAFDLERKIKPEKAGVREENSTQTAVDAQAKREARQELVALAAELEEAEAEGQAAKVKRLKGEIAKLKAVAGNESVLGGETGERARDNVRKAIEKVKAKLRKGNKDEQAFGVHVGRFVSLGYDVSYNQPERMNWE